MASTDASLGCRYTEHASTTHAPQMEEDVDTFDSQRPVSQVIGTPELKGVSDPLDRQTHSSSADDPMTASDDVVGAFSAASASTSSNNISGVSVDKGALSPLGVNTYAPRYSSPDAANNQQLNHDNALGKSGSWNKPYANVITSSSKAGGVGSASPVGYAGSPTEGASPTSESGGQASLSTTTGCYISGPLMPPAGYPMPLLGQGARSDQQHQNHLPHHAQQPQQHQQQHQHQQEVQQAQQAQAQLQPPHPAQQMQGGSPELQQPQPPFEDLRSSVISSSSSGSSSKPNSVKDMPPPPWAQPPKLTGTPGPRASSFDSGLDRNVLFNPEHIRGPAGEWVEVLRGEQGRIAIKSTPTQYEVLVWLPGFSINDITIVTRKNQVLHIVADQWDEQDHAQWEIRLGDDAVMSTVRAQFSGQELKITVARSGRAPSSSMSVHSNVSMRSASSRGAASLAANAGHSMHERSLSTPTQAWGDTDRRDLEARMNRGAEAFC